MEASGRDAGECASLPTFLSHVDCVCTSGGKMDGTIHGEEGPASKPVNPTRAASMQRK